MKKKIEARCKKGSDWKLYASWDGGKKFFVVKSYQPIHTCNRTDYESIQCKSSWLAKEYMLQFKDNPHFPVKQLQKEVMQTFGVKLSKWRCYRVKSMAHKIIHGDLTDHYSKLASYLQELKNKDENFIFKLQSGKGEGQKACFSDIVPHLSIIKGGFYEGL